jgi:hypothetical protein
MKKTVLAISILFIYQHASAATEDILNAFKGARTRGGLLGAEHLSHEGNAEWLDFLAVTQKASRRHAWANESQSRLSRVEDVSHRTPIVHDFSMGANGSSEHSAYIVPELSRGVEVTDAAIIETSYGASGLTRWFRTADVKLGELRQVYKVVSFGGKTPRVQGEEHIVKRNADGEIFQETSVQKIAGGLAILNKRLKVFDKKTGKYLTVAAKSSVNLPPEETGMIIGFGMRENGGSIDVQVMRENGEIIEYYYDLKPVDSDGYWHLKEKLIGWKTLTEEEIRAGNYLTARLRSTEGRKPLVNRIGRNQEGSK